MLVTETKRFSYRQKSTLKKVSLANHDEPLENTSSLQDSFPCPAKKKGPAEQKLEMLKQSFGILKSAAESIKMSRKNIPKDEINIKNE